MREDSCTLTHGVKHLFIVTYIKTFSPPCRLCLMPHEASFTTFHLLSARNGDGWFQQRI